MAGRKVRAETPEEKLDVIVKLLHLWEQCPNQRLGQLIWNVTSGRNIFNIEDAPLAEEFEEYRKQYGNKTNRP